MPIKNIDTHRVSYQYYSVFSPSSAYTYIFPFNIVSVLMDSAFKDLHVPLLLSSKSAHPIIKINIYVVFAVLSDPGEHGVRVDGTPQTASAVTFPSNYIFANPHISIIRNKPNFEIQRGFHYHNEKNKRHSRVKTGRFLREP